MPWSLAVKSTVARTPFLGLCPAASSCAVTSGSVSFSNRLSSMNPRDVDTQAGTRGAYSERERFSQEVSAWGPHLTNARTLPGERGHPCPVPELRTGLPHVTIGCSGSCVCVLSVCVPSMILELNCPILFFTVEKITFSFSIFWMRKIT